MISLLSIKENGDDSRLIQSVYGTGDQFSLETLRLFSLNKLAFFKFKIEVSDRRRILDTFYYLISRPGLHTYVWDHYERSVPMSTYLVAFVVSDFDVQKSEDGTFRVWARHEAINQSQYSLKIGPKILKCYEDYFKIKYPLPKMDMIALPDFSAGAMENWGLITYRWVYIQSRMQC